jgi:hypothetical protein
MVVPPTFTAVGKVTDKGEEELRGRNGAVVRLTKGGKPFYASNKASRKRAQEARKAEKAALQRNAPPVQRRVRRAAPPSPIDVVAPLLVAPPSPLSLPAPPSPIAVPVLPAPPSPIAVPVLPEVPADEDPWRPMMDWSTEEVEEERLRNLLYQSEP